MKKTTIIATSIVTGALLLFGCTNPQTPANVSKNLEHNLNVLSNSIKKLDTIDNTYLSNPDIYPVGLNNTIAQTCSVFADNSNFKLKINLDNNAPAPKTEFHKTTQIAANESTNAEEILTTNVDNLDNTSVNDNLVNSNTNQNLTKDINNFYYYDIKPIRYSPRYLTNMQNLDDNKEYLNNYINKVRNLYAITSDVIEANSTLSNCKDYVLTYVIEIKDLNNAIKDGSFEPSSQQIAALNNYIGDIKTTIKRIKKCNGELNDEVNSISKNEASGITTSIDVVKSNYLKVLNHLDTRITYLKNALTTLEQVKYLLQEAQNIIENPPIENIEIPSDIEINNENVNKETGIIDSNNSNDNQIVENDDNKDIVDNANNSPIIDATDDAVQDNIMVDSDNIENENNIDNNENIDSYINNSGNLDTYKPINEANNNNNLNNNVNENGINNNLNNGFNNGTNNNGVYNNGVNNGINNGTNNGIGIGGNLDGDRVNTPNGTFQNGIITQNNLNNGVNNGVNGYATGTGDNNLPYVPNGINQTNNNVNTYGYNTLIDMINRGTVNNGINTLDISEHASTKPSMVNNEIDSIELEDVDKEYTIELLNADSNVNSANENIDLIENNINNLNLESNSGKIITTDDTIVNTSENSNCEDCNAINSNIESNVCDTCDNDIKLDIVETNEIQDSTTTLEASDNTITNIIRM